MNDALDEQTVDIYICTYILTCEQCDSKEHKRKTNLLGSLKQLSITGYICKSPVNWSFIGLIYWFVYRTT